MNIFGKRLTVFLAVIALLCAFILPAAAVLHDPDASQVVTEPETQAPTDPAPQPNSNLTIVRYRIVDANGKSLTKLTRGTKFTLELQMKNSGIRTQEAGLKETKPDSGLYEGLDVSRLVDSFRGEDKPTVKLLSKDRQPLEFTLTFPNLTYTGYGNTFQCMVGYDNIDITYDTANITLIECEEYVEPRPTDPPTPDPTTRPAAATPNIIVKKYSYGDEQIMAGTTFPLTITFANTSSVLGVENIVMSIETEEGLAISASSNTFYFEKLGPGATQTQELEISAIGSDRSTSSGISISFRYEYVDDSTRNSQTSSEKIAVPVFQPDRFEVAPPELRDMFYSGQEAFLSFNYVNKGKGTIYNVEAKLESDDVSAVNGVQNLGNFEAGKSGTIDFVVTPFMAGEANLTVHISYENASGETVTKDYPLTLSVMDVDPDPVDPTIPDPVEPETEKKGSSLVWWLAGAAAVLIAFVVTALLVRRHKKKKADWELDDWEDGNEAP